MERENKPKRMVTRSEFYQEELILIEQIKELLKNGRKFNDPNNYLIPLKNDRSVTRIEHKERYIKLREVFSSLKEIIRIEGDLVKSRKEESFLNKIMDLIYVCTESKGEDQDIYLKSQISQILKQISLPKQENQSKKALPLDKEIKQ